MKRVWISLAKTAKL